MTKKMTLRMLLCGSVFLMACGGNSPFSKYDKVFGEGEDTTWQGRALLTTEANLTLTAGPSNQLLVGENVDVTFAFDNTSATDTGYYPYVRFILPPEFTYSSADNCEGLGTPSVTVDSTDPGVDLILNESIALAAGEKLVTVKPNTGQITPAQPAVSCKLTFTVSGQTAGTADLIRDARAIFALGNSPSGTRGACGSGDTICSTPQVLSITPTLLRLDLNQSAASPHSTGASYPRSYSIAGDLATGATLNNVVITNTLPDSLVLNSNCSGFSISPAATSCTITPDATAATGGTIEITYSTLSTDFTIGYNGYVRETSDAALAIVDVNTGVGGSPSNTVSLVSSEITTPISDSTTLTQNALGIKESVSNTNDIGGSGNTPGDELTYSIAMALSDFFRIKNVGLQNTVGDGLSYVGGSLNVQVIEGLDTTSCGESNLALGGHFASTANLDGSTTLSLDLGTAMADSVHCPGFSDDELWGGDRNFTGISTTVLITYKTIILDNFTTVPASGDNSIDAADTLANMVDNVTFDIIGGNTGLTRSTSVGASISEITTFTKSISHLDAAPILPPVSIEAGNTVTYKLSATIPGGDAEDFTITDYLPKPMFGVSVCPTHDASDTIPPPANNWSFGTNESGVTAGSVSVACSATDNRIQFAFPDFDTAGGASKTIEIYFTTTALPEPIQDGLLQVNISRLTYNNSNNTAAATAVGTVNFIGLAPAITIAKNITSTDHAGAVISSGDVTGVDGNDTLTYTVTLTNGGHGTAYDVSLEDVLPAGLRAPATTGVCTGSAACGYNIDVSDSDCSNSAATTPDIDTSTDQTKIKITDMQLAEGAVCTLSYQIKTKADVEFAASIVNTGTVTFAGAPSGTLFSPESDTATATIASPTVSIAQSITTGVPGDVQVYTVTVNLPEGQASSAKLMAIENTNFWGNPSTVAITGGQTGSGPFCSSSDADICSTNDATISGSWDNSSNTQFTINLGTLSNIGTDNSSAALIFEITGQIRGVTSGTKNANGRINWNSSNNVTSSAVTVTVQNPALSIVQCLDSATSAAQPLSLADTVGYRMIVKNTGTSKAFDIDNLSDTLPKGIKYTPDTVNAYYCSAGASSASCSGWSSLSSCTGTLTDVTAGVRGGDTAEASPFGGDSRQVVSFPILDNTSNPDIVAGGYVVLEFAPELSCEIAPDNATPSATGSHPDANGILDGCTDPVADFAASISNSSSIAAYTSLDGVVSGERTYSAVNSNATTATLDHDGDGIANSLETSSDADGDGVPNYLDTDSDDNGIDDTTEGTGDADGDGTPDYKDTDDDNDSLNDAAEIIASGGTAVDSDGDGTPDYLDPDSDGDGVADGDEGTVSTDTDGDGTPNYLDLDSDDDGVPDMLEFNLASHDTNGDGKLSPAEITASGLDTNSDGAINANEYAGSVLPDSDGDGTPNFIDLDSDNDGLIDMDEAGLISYDVNIDGHIDDAERAAIDDGAGSDLSGGAHDNNSVVNLDEIPDSDGDGTSNYLDADSDNDGVADIIESGRYICDVNFNNQIDYPGEVLGCVLLTDTNLDGYFQISEASLTDTDTDLTADYLDVDADGDGIADLIEAYASDIDTSLDGEISAAEYAVAAAAVGDNDGNVIYSELADTDGDTLPDMYDLDSDGDGINDADERGGAAIVYYQASLSNSDGSDNVDFRDTDSDNDGLSDSNERVAGGAYNVDTDGDSTYNYVDADSDGDGVLDGAEGAYNADSDGDSIANFMDQDSDNDGIPDDIEFGLSAYDTDGNGKISSAEFTASGLDTNSDKAFSLSEIGGALVDSDGDSIADYLDRDSDDDGVTDTDEAGFALFDVNADGRISEAERAQMDDGSGTDVTGGSFGNNGVVNFAEVLDTDGDSIPNYLDLDSDSDGVVDIIENNRYLCDTNTNNRMDYPSEISSCVTLSDANADGFLQVSESALLDHDSDSTPDSLDSDSDGDGIGDLIEAFSSNRDLNNDGYISSAEYTSAGLAIGNNDGELTFSELAASDGDGTPDLWDLDSDADGASDAVERGVNNPVYLLVDLLNSDGSDEYDFRDLDSDNDGIPDVDEVLASGGAGTDTDGDGTPDYLDRDSDGDGILDESEGSPTLDTDSDGIPDFHDVDSDSDGIPDLIEQGLGAYDTNGDGTLSPSEVTASGLDIDLDATISKAELGGNFLDTDNDGTPDFQDLDSDNDGLSDTEEAGLIAYDINSNRRISPSEYALMDDGVDSDVSGGAFDNNSVLNLDELPDTDSDGTPDYADIDSDSDGVPDIVENHRYVCDANSNGQIDYPSEITGCLVATDIDSDGFIQDSEYAVFDHDSDLTPDYLDRDSDDDGIGDLIEAYAADQDTNFDGLISAAEYVTSAATVGDNDGTLEIAELVDTDSDSTPDIWDTDSDGDTISDNQESDATPLSAQYLRSGLYNTDATDDHDFRDTDSDDDGYLDSVEAGDASILTLPVDTDSDGTPDFQDLDSDNDLLADSDELVLATNRILRDSDGDLAEDGCEVYGNTLSLTQDCPYDDVNNSAWYPGSGTVGSPLTDPKDADSDDGGTNDYIEATSSFTDPRATHGADDPWHMEDPDNDGLTNDEEVLLGTDLNNNDSDGDGLSDGCEVLGTTPSCPYADAANNAWHTTPGVLNDPVSSPLDTDSDDDGLLDNIEASNTRTNPRNVDTDGDAVNDFVENTIGSNPNDIDTDDDGLSDGQEVNTLNTDPLKQDTDGDGCADKVEVDGSIDPLTDPDSDGDKLTDCQEVGTYGTDHLNIDTDGGGMDDGLEVITMQTNPLDASDDCPTTRDSDGDGVTDCEEIAAGTNPNDVGDLVLQGSATKSLFGCASQAHSNPLPLVLLTLILLALRFSVNVTRLLKVFFAFAMLGASGNLFALNVQLFKPNPAAGGGASIQGSESLDPARYRLGATFNYVKNPLEFGRSNGNDRIDSVANYFYTVDLLLSLGISKDLDFLLDVPINITDEVEPIADFSRNQSTTVGDILLGVKYTVVKGFAISPYLTVPLDNQEDFFGDTNVTGGLNFIFDRQLSHRHYVAFNTGLRFRERERILNLNVGNELTAKLGYIATINKTHAWDVFVELFGSTTLDDFLDSELTSPYELIAGIQKRWAQWKILVGGGRGGNNGYGSPDVRAFAQLVYQAPARESNPTPLPTPTPEPKKLEQFLIISLHAEDGSSIEHPSLKVVNDDNSVRFEGSETRVRIPIEVGTYKIEASADGFNRAEASATIKADDVDTEISVTLKKKTMLKKIEVLEPILFDINKDTIKLVSYPILDHVAKVMLENPEIKRVKIEAHTDSQSSESYNLDLSNRRAKSVMTYLIEKGVSAERLSYQGFGESKPIADNATKEGRAKNRRVEFLVEP